MITEEELRRLYCDDLKSEQEIAEAFGTYQVKVGRLRRKFGIPTISKAQRLERQLPPLTTFQVELLVGSLLGDGHMKESSRASARFIERHGESQAPYLMWKAGLLGDYISSTYPTVKRLPDGREFHGMELNTKSCPQLRGLFDLFYQSGKKVFPASLPDLMTPMVLAVWYLDDGSLASNYHPRIHFGLGSRSLKRAVKALRRLGLKPDHRGENGDQMISFPGQGRKFFDLVRPHIPDCMSYKVPRTDSPRRVQDRNASQVTPEMVGRLYSDGMSLGAIARRYGVGRSTVHRRLKAVGATPRRMGRPRAGYTVESATVLLGNLDPILGTDQLLEEALRILKKTPFPFPAPMDETEAHKELARVQKSKSGITSWTPVGVRVCNSLFPNRYKATYKSNVSAWEGWHDEKHLRRAIRFQVRVGDPVIPKRVLRALTANCRTPSVFRPVVARYLYETYCPSGGVVWDPCSGYGGRLLGALAAGVGKYIGTDVEPETVGGNRRLAALLGMEDRAEIHLNPAETFDPGPVDLVFTSPPYFNLELYGRSRDQSSVTNSGFEEWVSGFLVPVLVTAYRRLPDGGVLVLNVTDVRQGRKTFPLVEAAIREAVTAGFKHEDTLRMPLASLNRKNASEPLLVFRRR